MLYVEILDELSCSNTLMSLLSFCYFYVTDIMDAIYMQWSNIKVAYDQLHTLVLGVSLSVLNLF